MSRLHNTVIFIMNQLTNVTFSENSNKCNEQMLCVMENYSITNYHM